MLNRRLRPEAWQAYFDALSKQLREGKRKAFATLHAVVPEMTGTHVATRGMPLRGLTYDPGEQALYLAFDGLTRRIARPKAIWGAAGPNGDINAYLILGSDGSRHTLELRSDPAPHEAEAPVPANGFGNAVRSWWLRVRRRRPDRPRRPHGGGVKPHVWPSQEPVPEAPVAEQAVLTLDDLEPLPAPGPLRETCQHVRETFRASTPG